MSYSIGKSVPQIIKTFLVGLIFVAPFCVNAQSTLFQQGSKEYILLDRLEIKLQQDSLLNFSFIKPFNRKWWASALDRADSSSISLSVVDRYNISRSRLNNLEWTSNGISNVNSKKSVLNTFFKDPANMVGVNEKDFFLSVNPILQLQAMRDGATDEMLYLNTRGAVVRSLIGGKVGFHAYLTENQEKTPVFVRNDVYRFRAVPGAGRYKIFKGTGFDYFDARGTVFFNAAKFINVQFGFDKMFLGNGYRSLFISDHSNSHLFLNMNLRVWKLNYMSRIMELTPQYTRDGLGGDSLYPKKYASIHHISFNAPKWLTLGLFEGVVFGRKNHFEFSYLNPVMFIRGAELNIGSPDNSFIGFDAKANLAKQVQLYGQVMLDEFYTKYIRERKGWWGNKWAFQAGMKYIDVLGVENLDLQLETNWIRPFTYSHFDTVANYTHYNQALAHPLMSNIKEYIGILKFQPAPKWYMQAKTIYWQSGADTARKNFGNNIFLDNDTRALPQHGYFFGTPMPRKNLNASFWLAYEIRENLFLETNLVYRKIEGLPSNMMSSIGMRWNMHRREYDY
jgi:hypothetical protein